ncbi:hypothetical protein E2320_012198, partial [Naja naja]
DAKSKNLFLFPPHETEELIGKRQQEGRREGKRGGEWEREKERGREREGGGKREREREISPQPNTITLKPRLSKHPNCYKYLHPPQKLPCQSVHNCKMWFKEPSFYPRRHQRRLSNPNALINQQFDQRFLSRHAIPAAKRERHVARVQHGDLLAFQQGAKLLS